ncbi:Pro-kumamolisin, activation domain-containing protein [Podospora appendiculata]|uniref:Pro-kumamolisin, activation domain-containing protein n=1 Tax=Podospora appendiculata TaxID=314037 RepID=A0AAE1CCY6_9PEZI|nr:Pro-kumamolisin, activation domain-containing protein [Podospora appendiculata]
MRVWNALLAVAGLSGALESAALASPFEERAPRRRIPSSHVIHERHETPNLEGWVRRERADPTATLPMRIGLRQSNLDEGHELLMDISDPTSPNFGKHLTSSEVVNLFAPAVKSVGAVRGWLMASGIDEQRLSQSFNKQWIQFDAAVEDAEKLLFTTYYVFEHLESGVKNIACSEYHLPDEVAPHVDYITPGIKLMSGGYDKEKVQQQELRKRQSEEERKQQQQGGRRPRRRCNEPPPPEGVQDEKWFKIKGPCTYEVTPDCVRNQYQIPNGTTATPGNELGVFQSLNQHYHQWDLDMYWKYTAPYIPRGTHPELRSINGALGPTTVISDAGTEADLDFQVVTPLIWPQRSVLWQTDDEWYQREMMQAQTKYNGFFNTLFDAIDGSYCTFSAYGATGNCDVDACRDPEYPNTHDPETGYQGDLMCGAYEPTNVLSISYSGFEHILPASYMRRQCLEILKLGLQGVTVIESSGDYGVGGRRMNPREGCLGPDADVFSPRIMSNCPYVLSVGATALVDDPTPGAKGRFVERATTTFASGGGFSNVFDTPKWQAAHVETYLRRANMSHVGYVGGGKDYGNVGKVPGLLFNKAGRGYPDVAAIGDNYRIITAGYSQRVAGTSVAVPIWSSVVTLINEERLKAGKSPVGFMHQVLYKHPEVFNDITIGSNPGCGGPGFEVKEGWDPVTGLGTPIYPKLLELFMSLP